MHVSRWTGLPLLPVLVLGALILTAKTSQAQVVPYFGDDAGKGPADSHRDSDAAAATFDSDSSSLGPETLVNFESAPAGSFSSLTIAPGVTLTGSNGSNQTIENQDLYAVDHAPIALAANFAYNTTRGGTNYLVTSGGSVTFTFASPIQGFGGYFTGERFSGDKITFNDGSSRSLNLTTNGTGVQFLGFLDYGAQITSLTFTSPSNIAGVDDVRFIAVTPEPASYAAFAFGGLGLLGLGLKARTRQNATGILIEPKWD